jgi:hypothetical protein
MIPQFAAVEVSPSSFVLADKLQFCRFSFLTTDPRQPLAPPVWKPSWSMTGWPRGVRIEMAPLNADSSTLQPITITAPIRLRRSPEIPYVDFEELLGGTDHRLAWSVIPPWDRPSPCVVKPRTAGGKA